MEHTQMKPTTNPGEARPEPTPRNCPVCNNDGFWVDVQPNRHTGDAEQVQVGCEFCANRNRITELERSLATAHAKLEAAGSSAARTEATLWQRKFEEAQGRIGDLEKANERLATDEKRRVEDFLSDRHCCNGQECGCGGVTRLQQCILEEAGDQITALRARITQLESERENWRVSSVCREQREEIAGLRDKLAQVEAERDRLLAGCRETARVNHETTAQFKAEEVASGFINMVLTHTWDKDHMTRILEGWMMKGLRAAQQEADTWEARTRWLMERATYNGGGNGGKFNIAFETPLDSECDITQLDAARSAANGEEK